MTRVAIMQPTYLPWLGYFGLMNSVDLFVLLDSVQFARRSWQQRNLIKTPNGSLCLTVPVLGKGKRNQLITEVEIDRSQNFASNHKKTIEMSYRKSPYFNEYSEKLFSIIGANENYLANVTTNLITWIRDELGITTPIKRSSDFVVTDSKAEMLANLCEKVGATEYISPPGSYEYLEASDAFAIRNISVRYFQFEHLQYPQLYSDFITHMSIIDLIFNVGKDSIVFLEKGSQVVMDPINY